MALKNTRGILVARYSGQVADDPFQVAMAAVAGRRLQALGACLRHLGSGAPGFFGSLSQVAELQLGVACCNGGWAASRQPVVVNHAVRRIGHLPLSR